MRRTLLKWLHWLTFGLLLYFFFVEPEVENSAAQAVKSEALSTHAGVGMLLGLIVVVWTLIYLRQGLAGRAGPKLPAIARKAHPLKHRVLHWLLPVMMITGGVSGLVAPFPISGFGAIPLTVPFLGSLTLHDLATEVHELVFNALTIVVIVHIAFHLWRHYLLRDNALRIMAPKLLHRFL